MGVYVDVNNPSKTRAGFHIYLISLQNFDDLVNCV